MTDVLWALSTGLTLWVLVISCILMGLATCWIIKAVIEEWRER